MNMLSEEAMEEQEHTKKKPRDKNLQTLIKENELLESEIAKMDEKIQVLNSETLGFKSQSRDYNIKYKEIINSRVWRKTQGARSIVEQIRDRL